MKKITLKIASLILGVCYLVNCLNAQTINGLDGYFPLNGNAKDYSGNGNNGTLLNSPTSTLDKYGNSDHAYDFSRSSSQYVRCGDILDNIFAPATGDAFFTITGWANSNSWAPYQGGNIIVGKSPGGSGTTYQWFINHDNDGKIKGAVITDGTGGAFLEHASGTVNTGTWFHFALVFDGSQSASDRVKLYVNGVAGSFSRSGSGTLGTKTLNTNQEITIGAGHNQGSPSTPNNLYDGKIDDIRIYNRVLTNDEIKTLADFDLLVYYPFNVNGNNLSGIGGYNCTPQNSPVHDTDRLGDSLWAYRFNRSANQYLLCGDVLDSIFSPSTDTAVFSITGWAKSNSWAPFQGGNIIVGKCPGGNGTSYQWYVNHDNDGRVKGVVCTTGDCSNYIELRSGVISTGQWFQFALTFNGFESNPSDRIKLYVNGVAGTSSRSLGTLGTKTANTNQELTVGSGHNQNAPSTPNNLYDGTIDEIRIYHHALSLSQAFILRKTSVEEIANNTNELSIYPNPSSNGIFNIQGEANSQYSVFNIMGAEVAKGSLTQSLDKIDLSNFKAGIYTIHLTGNNFIKTARLFISE